MTAEGMERLHWDALAVTFADAVKAAWDEPEAVDGTRCEAALRAWLDLATLPTAGRVLDLGCGYGRLLVPLAMRYAWAEFVGVDVSLSMINHARAWAERYRADNVVVLVGDGRRLPTDDEYDAAWTVLCFQHLPPDACAGYCVEVARRLRPGGRFVVQTVTGGPDDEGPWSRPVTADVLRCWMEAAGLRVAGEAAGLVRPTWLWAVGERAGA